MKNLKLLILAFLLVARFASAMEPIPDEQLLDPFQDNILKVLWTQQTNFNSKKLGYIVAEGTLLDADHPMDHGKQVQLATLVFPNEKEPAKKIPILNTALKELASTMITINDGAELFKAGAPKDTAWIIEITGKGQTYLKQVGYVP